MYSGNIHQLAPQLFAEAQNTSTLLWFTRDVGLGMIDAHMKKGCPISMKVWYEHLFSTSGATGRIMETLFIADGNLPACEEMARLFSLEGFHVVPSGSVVEILREVRGLKPRVLLLSGKLNDLPSAELIPLLRKCNKNLKIILVGEELPPVVRDRIGHEGVVFFRQTPMTPSEKADLIEVVRRAMEIEGPD